MSLTAIIKRAAREQVESTQPVAVLYGKVLSADPLEVNVEQRFTLTADFIVVPEHVGIVLTGDRVILLRVAGGRQYIVLGRLAS
jgi:hypothetical protein